MLHVAAHLEKGLSLVSAESGCGHDLAWLTVKGPTRLAGAATDARPGSPVVGVGTVGVGLLDVGIVGVRAVGLEGVGTLGAGVGAVAVGAVCVR